MLIVLVQEPWLVSNAIKGLSVTGRVYTSREHVGQRACVVVRGLEAALMQEFSTRDLAVVKIRGKDGVNRGKEFIVASAYCAHESKSPPEEVKRLTRYCRKEGLGFVVGCDANAHNEAWGSTDMNERGKELLNYLVEENLVVLNTGGKPTFVTSNRSEVLDITFCSGLMKGWVHDWRVSVEPSM